jgi:hypothetical protein
VCGPDRHRRDVVRRASSALADVDIAGWTRRFDLLSDPNRLDRDWVRRPHKPQSRAA